MQSFLNHNRWVHCGTKAFDTALEIALAVVLDYSNSDLVLLKRVISDRPEPKFYPELRMNKL
jgi:hypothetical protein